MTAYEEALKRAVRTCAELRADDPRFDGSTHVVHEDGSVFFTDSSFIEEWESPGGERFIFVYAEHHPPRVFVEDDLVLWRSPGRERTPRSGRYGIR